MIAINRNNCIICCECINVCRGEVLGILNGNVAIIRPNQCTNCEDCVDICENGGIIVSYDC